MSNAANILEDSDGLEALKRELVAAIAAADSMAALDEIRVAALGKKGRITDMMKTLGALAPDTRKARGAALNVLKDEIAAAIDDRQKILSAKALSEKLARESIDVTLSVRPQSEGRVHPIPQTIDELTTIFASMGFTVANGPDIESDWNNFGALNFPPDHPARQMLDTFFMPSQNDQPMVLRTHTSSVQVRTMMSQKPPIRIIAPGRTYRYENDMTHAPMFHQIEALVIDEATHMGHLKGCLLDFMRAFFGIADLPFVFVILFPFYRTGAPKSDIGCSRKNGEMKLGYYGGTSERLRPLAQSEPEQEWLEIGGCGMVHPNVLRNCGIDPEKYQGFAFGMGIERMAMLKYGIPDVRNFFESDLRWLKHYGFLPLDIPNPALKG